MTEFKTKQFLGKLEQRVWELIKPIYRLNQRYQRQPFGRMTSVHVLDEKEFKHSRNS